MRLNNSAHKDYTIRGDFYQLKLPLNIELNIEYKIHEERCKNNEIWD